MAKSTAEIQKRSDDKRGVKTKSFKIKKDIFDLVEKISLERGLAQNAMITEAILLYAEKYGIQTDCQ
ncbi:hypothetical protein CFY87_03635 [Actinobacillus seminis]|uniref:Uncharacterized protein n=2 Tax=Pasteurellaceae TaxID=712 RepID=A0AAX2RY81_HISSO|nr:MULTISPECIES: hypothetical protein [Pasteurellaceae]OZN25248.1 hypothetical protein CFY87_03635 [Actinobacillus seminis]TDF37792.1 hypothetical protein E1290_07770 [Histophilus somni]TEW29070.1 hypothetical protein E2R48_07645 [Histophilus somni]TFF02185.1 hypothetical protein E3U35_03120 [Histophilus somni]THA21355.1 hypothetical protein E5361_06505 [Histophilus somni]